MPLHCCIASLLAAKYQLCCFRYGLRLFTIHLALPLPPAPHSHSQQQHLNCLVDTDIHTSIYYIAEPDNDRYGTIEDFSLHIVVVIFSNLDSPDLHFHRTLPNQTEHHLTISIPIIFITHTSFISLPHLVSSHHITS